MEALRTAEKTGWRGDFLTPQETLDLFRPTMERTVTRCEVKLLNNIYFSQELDFYHGEEVREGAKAIERLRSEPIPSPCRYGESIYGAVAEGERRHQVAGVTLRLQFPVEIAGMLTHFL
jgi:hypothetical protein